MFYLDDMNKNSDLQWVPLYDNGISWPQLDKYYNDNGTVIIAKQLTFDANN